MFLLKKVSVLFWALFLFPGMLWAQEFKDGVKQGVVRVKLKPEIGAKLHHLKMAQTNNGLVQTGVQALDATSTTLSVSSMKRVFPYSAKHDAKHRKHGLHLWYELTYDVAVSPAQAIRAYVQTGQVQVAERVLQKRHITGEVTYLETSKVKQNEAMTEPFDDPFLNLQWHYHNTGQVTPSIPEGDVNLYEAWETQTGSRDVIVSIVDGGIDVEHLDLADNMWVNEAEMNGDPDVDDDGNGYIDDIYGFNHVNGIGEVLPDNHGTHVAGTVGAVNNNGIGVAGVAGGSGQQDGVRLMSSQVFTETNSGGHAAAIVYGADNGAVISQNSWGYLSPGYYEESVLDAINYFIETAGDYEGSLMQGGIVIFASGNDHVDDEMYPSYFPQVYTVAALRPDNQVAYYSNYGTWIDISAPGGDFSLGQETAVLSTLPNNSYGYLQGTSMACPHVSGIAALAVAQHGGPDFTAQELELYLNSSTHDIDQYNPNYVGKLGVGYIDAALTLNKNEGIRPEAITDLTLHGAAQDYFNLSWTIPADEDDGYPSLFKVYYHTEELTADNLSEANVISLGNKEAAGTSFHFELKGLASLTTYYVAVVAVDRWSNTADLSNMVSGTTNRGPDIEVTESSLYLNANEASDFLTEGTFEISNLDEGELKWEGFLRHKNHSYDYYSTQLEYPTSKASVHTNVNIREAAFRHGLGTLVEAVPLNSESDTISYGDGFLTVIGETDTTVTNSSALRYRVAHKEGFNLTHLSMPLAADPVKGKVILEIYRGEKLEPQNLFYAQEVYTYSPDPIIYTIPLEEQIYFPEGETFWVVFHVPSGNLYPLGVEGELDPSMSDHAYMSFDLGKTWASLNDVYDDTKVWATRAISMNAHLGEYVTLSPMSGSVAANESEIVTLNVDATTLINGYYNANILLKTNDDDEKEYRLPITIDVKEQKPELRTVDVVSFGNVFYGEQQTLRIPITNMGYGHFSEAQVISNDPQFTVHDLGWGWKVPARDYAYVTVTYKPAAVGNHNATLDLVDMNGNTHQVPLFGVGTAPAEISVTPSLQTLPPMAIGEQTTAKFTISNTGEYPLHYTIPAYTEVSSTQDESIHKFGYSYLNSNVEGSELDFIWEDISQTGVDITENFHKTHPDYKYYKVDVGFDFPFYEEVVREWYLNRYGVLTIDTEGPLGNCYPPSLDNICAPKGAISALGHELDILKSGGTIHYQKMAGKFILQYTGVYVSGAYGDWEKMTFQVVLFANGDIEFRYLDVEGMYINDLYFASIGMTDRHYQDAFVMNGDQGPDVPFTPILQRNQTSFRVKHPGARLVTSLSKSEGVLMVGESEEIEMLIETAHLIEGEQYQNISILSNDPFNPKSSVKLELLMNGGGVVHTALSTDVLDFGEVFQMAEKSMVLTLSNTGSKAVDITSVETATENFVVAAEFPQALKAKTSNYIPVQLNTAETMELEDVLTITLANGEVYEVALSAKIIDAPSISVDITSIEKTLDAGTKETVALQIENTGKGTLDVILQGNEWMYEAQAEETPAQTANHLPEFAYAYTTTKQENGPQYNWRDIVGTGERISMQWYFEEEQFWKEVPLPFTFNLYNEPTDTLWISWQGVITTESPRINPPYMDPEDFPKATEPNSLIAPFFGIHNYEVNPATAAISGVFYEFFDDHIVITWNEVLDKYGIGGFYNFQAILHENGTIKYQYNSISPAARFDLGIVGLENKDGTDGVFVSGFQNFVEHEMAIVFTPGIRQQIQGNTTQAFTLDIDAQQLNAGLYTDHLTIHNNTVETPHLKIPTTLEVLGAPMIETPDTIDFGQVMAYEAVDDWGFPSPKAYYHEFELKNTGSDDLSILSTTMESGAEMKVERYVLVNPFFGMYAWQEIWGRFDIQPGAKEAIRVSLQPTGDVAALTDAVIFETNMSDAMHKIPVSAMVSKAPKAQMLGEEVNVFANTPAHTESRTLTLSNAEGEGTLAYELSIEFMRSDAMPSLASTLAISTNQKMGNAPLKAQTIATPLVGQTGQNTVSDTYNMVLEHDQATAPDTYIGFGGGQSMVAATRFVAPESGFNLSHIQTWYQPQDVLSSEIVVYIVEGESLETATLLNETTYNYTIEEEDLVGTYLTIELDEPQQLYPNEQFFVG